MKFIPLTYNIYFKDTFICVKSKPNKVKLKKKKK